MGFSPFVRTEAEASCLRLGLAAGSGPRGHEEAGSWGKQIGPWQRPSEVMDERAVNAVVTRGRGKGADPGGGAPNEGRWRQFQRWLADGVALVAGTRRRERLDLGKGVRDGWILLETRL